MDTPVRPNLNSDHSYSDILLNRSVPCQYSWRWIDNQTAIRNWDLPFTGYLSVDEEEDGQPESASIHVKIQSFTVHSPRKACRMTLLSKCHVHGSPNSRALSRNRCMYKPGWVMYDLSSQCSGFLTLPCACACVCVCMWYALKWGSYCQANRALNVICVAFTCENFIFLIALRVLKWQCGLPRSRRLYWHWEMEKNAIENVFYTHIAESCFWEKRVQKHTVNYFKRFWGLYGIMG